MADTPNLLVTLEQHWLDEGFDAFKAGTRDRLMFGTGTPMNTAKDVPGIRYIYFRGTGCNFITARADFIDITSENQPELRLPDRELSLWGKPGHAHYYVFTNLTWIKWIPTGRFRRYGDTGEFLTNDYRGTAFLVHDPVPPEEDAMGQRDKETGGIK